MLLTTRCFHLELYGNPTAVAPARYRKRCPQERGQPKKFNGNQCRCYCCSICWSRCREVPAYLVTNRRDRTGRFEQGVPRFLGSCYCCSIRWSRCLEVPAYRIPYNGSSRRDVSARVVGCYCRSIRWSRGREVPAYLVTDRRYKTLRSGRHCYHCSICWSRCREVPAYHATDCSDSTGRSGWGRSVIPRSLLLLLLDSLAEVLLLDSLVEALSRQDVSVGVVVVIVARFVGRGAVRFLRTLQQIVATGQDLWVGVLYRSRVLAIVARFVGRTYRSSRHSGWGVLPSPGTTENNAAAVGNVGTRG